jgi:hypothetical protein
MLVLMVHEPTDDVVTHCMYLLYLYVPWEIQISWDTAILLKSDPAFTLRRYIWNTQYADINCISCIVYVYTSRYDSSNKKEVALKKGSK